jgi:hypothetical protein
MSDHDKRRHLNREVAAIDDMPAEMIDAIISSLRPHDLTVLARVSKKYREIAQSALWRCIELHRQDEHHQIFGLTTLKDTRRSHLDDALLDSWSYRDDGGRDHVFDRHRAKFATAVRKLYRTAGKSQAWTRLAPLVQHMCLTVTYMSPPQIWDMILSLPNLATIEIVGEDPINGQGPPQPATLRAPGARTIQDVRLRGYVPAKFVLELCKASASSIASLDLGALEPPKVFCGDADEMELQKELGYPLYVAPRGVLWFSQGSAVIFGNLTRLLLCKRGSFDGPPDMSEDEDFEIREDDAHECIELKQWASLLRSVRSTIVEVVLEQRPVYLS